MLQDKIKQCKKAIDAKKSEVAEKKQAFEAKKAELAEADVDITNAEEPLVVAADQAMRPYSEASDELATLQGQLERLVMMDASGGERTVDVRSENELDRHPHEARSSLGQATVQSETYRELSEGGAFGRDGLKAELSEPMNREQFVSELSGGRQAALLTGQDDAAGGVLQIPQRFPGVVDLPQLPLGILDLVTVGQTDANAVEYVRLLARTINAAEVAEAISAEDIDGVDVTAAEGGQKPESGLTFEEVIEAVKNIAHWIPGTRNQLADAPFLASLIDSELRQGVERRAESQIIKGNGVGVNLKGILAQPGIASYTQGTADAGEPFVDAVHRLHTLIALSGFNVTADAIHPNDWQEIRLSKDANENYIFGPPSLAGQMQLWGYPVVSTIAVNEGTSLAGEWPRALFLVREAVKVLVSDSHKDWFTRNIVAILAEMRGVLAVPRPQAFGKAVAA